MNEDKDRPKVQLTPAEVDERLKKKKLEWSEIPDELSKLLDRLVNKMPDIDSLRKNMSEVAKMIKTKQVVFAGHDDADGSTTGSIMWALVDSVCKVKEDDSKRSALVALDMKKDVGKRFIFMPTGQTGEYWKKALEAMDGVSLLAKAKALILLDLNQGPLEAAIDLLVKEGKLDESAGFVFGRVDHHQISDGMGAGMVVPRHNKEGKKEHIDASAFLAREVAREFELSEEQKKRIDLLALVGLVGDKNHKSLYGDELRDFLQRLPTELRMGVEGLADLLNMAAVSPHDPSSRIEHAEFMRELVEELNNFKLEDLGRMMKWFEEKPYVKGVGEYLNGYFQKGEKKIKDLLGVDLGEGMVTETEEEANGAILKISVVPSVMGRSLSIVIDETKMKTGVSYQACETLFKGYLERLGKIAPGEFCYLQFAFVPRIGEGQSVIDYRNAGLRLAKYSAIAIVQRAGLEVAGGRESRAGGSWELKGERDEYGNQILKFMEDMTVKSEEMVKEALNKQD